MSNALNLEQALEVINNVTLDQVKSVYRGKVGCCCGCNGIHRDYSGCDMTDGYSKVNDRFVKKILKFVKSEALNAEGIDFSHSFISITVSEKRHDMYYILYLRPGVDVGYCRHERNRKGEWVDFYAEQEKEHQRFNETILAAEESLRRGMEVLGLKYEND